MLSLLAGFFAMAYDLQIEEQTTQLEIIVLRNVAPTGQATDYDRQNLAVYAELLDADAAGIDWANGARQILGLDATADGETARKCWESHLARAHWIVGEGLGSALQAFDQKSEKTR
jgi:hypothetical protein